MRGQWLLDDFGDLELVEHRLRRVGERLGLGEAGAGLVGARHIKNRQRMGSRLHPGEIELRQRLKKRVRESGRRIVVLHRHPLLTSGRKIDLYTPWETLLMLARAVVTGGRSFRKRETAHLWYDGRR